MRAQQTEDTAIAWCIGVFVAGVTGVSYPWIILGLLLGLLLDFWTAINDV